MNIKKLLSAAIVFMAILSSLAWSQNDCDEWTTSTIRNCNGIDYELWNQRNSGSVNMKITGGSTNPNGGTFEATWSGTENILFRAGKKWGSSSTTTAQSIGNISLDFEATWSSGDNVKMLGVYGWAYYPSGDEPTQDEDGQSLNFSNQIEYYIIQDRGSYDPASGGTNAQKYGEATIDGFLYEFYVADRIGQPMLTGDGNFKQYFSVPKSTSSHRQSGVINIAKHFEEWDKVGMQMLDCPLYEIAMKVESYTGASMNSSGSANVTKNLLSLGGSSTNEYSLVTNVSPAGAGTVTKSPNNATYAPDASVQLTANANSGWRFVGWEGDASGSTSTTSIIMSSDRTVTAKFALESGEGTVNLIKDGDFTSSNVISTADGASWKLGQGEYWGNSVATSSVSNGVATVSVTTTGEQAYQPQLVQYGVALDEDALYKLTFKASAATARKIEVSFQQSVDPWAGYASREFDLTTTEQEFVYVFAMTSESDPDAQFAFNLGQATGDVHISDVKLVHTTDSPTVATLGEQALAFYSDRLYVSLQGKSLHISPDNGSKLQVKIVDANGKVKANFTAEEPADFSVSNISAGLYFLDISGVGIQQFTPIILE
jgi:uncharacterized repeat protein (TIGR02543 family)